jgi:predicted MFS family arabinose efflux permease
VWPVVALAASYKLGLHLAAVLIKPMVVDAHWTTHEIAITVVAAGTGAGLLGAVAGGVAHKKLGDARALLIAGVVQAVVCVPLIAAATLGAPRGITIAAIAGEHFASGIGTTVLFAALMSATRPANAGLHYTILTSANALSIGVGGLIGGRIGDRLGYPVTYAIAGAVCLAPLLLLPRWKTASAASAT